ncbi:MAG: heavy metal translocating P-type ATPase [Elainellaceae cyanobacterium]
MQVVPSKTNAPSQASLETFTLDVSGMKCAGCVRTVENQLTQQPGVVSATVNLVTEVAIATCEAGAVDPTALAHKLTEVGFPTAPRQAPNFTTAEQARSKLNPAEQQQKETRDQIRRATIAIVLLFLSTVGHLDHFGWFTIPGLNNIWLHWGFATLALLGPGRSILIDGWRGVRHNAPNMNTLVGLGTLTAYTASVVALLIPRLGWECFFDEPVMLVGFILLGRTLEQRARGKATEAFQALVSLQPVTARLVNATSNKAAEDTDQESLAFSPQSAVEIPTDHVKVGEWLQVLPGEKIPVDGEVIIGQTTVNESMLTGEAMPVLKQAGDPVAAGSLNLSGAIVLKATHTGQDTTLAHIIALVEEAQTRKAPIQKLADIVAGYFTYGVITIATLTFLFWYFIGVPLGADQLLASGHTMMHASHPLVPSAAADSDLLASPSALLLSLKLAIAVLVIACPCALGLATPTAILVGSSIGAEQGLLIRGGDILEKVHQLDTIVFDKTGTLTVGHPTVTDCISLSQDYSATTLLQIAASAESGTQHPVANAIQQQASQQELQLLSAEEFHTEPGLGMSAVVETQVVVLGTPTWLRAQGIEIGSVAHQQAQTLTAGGGKTVVYVGISGQLAGLIAVQDTVRLDAQSTIAQLKQMGLRVVMMTGDQLSAATAIARSLGLSPDDVLAEVRPDQKSQAIAQLQQQKQVVAMVGDGINDAPALAQADVGIALRSGTDVAIETAGIILMHDRLNDVVKSIYLSRATFNKIRQNLFWAFIYNLVGIPVAAGVLLPIFGLILSPATAGAFMAFSSVSVVMNSLLLRRTFSNRALLNG